LADNNIYVINHTDISVSTAITIIQIKAAAAVPLEIMRVSVSQRSSTTSTMQRIQLIRKTGAATVTSFTPLKLNPNDPAANAVGSTTGTGITASGEGTDGDIVYGDVFNILTGWLYLPTPEERIWVPGGGILGLKFPAAPSAANFTALLYFRELG
jgi:hypothetical protein